MENLNKEKQIEEMCNIGHEAIMKYGGTTNCPCERCPFKDKPITCDTCAMAHELYNAGYRKQSEGEWVETTEPLGAHDVPCVECSVCNESYVLDEDFDLDVVHTFWNYCPNCGAKMRGDAE